MDPIIMPIGEAAFQRESQVDGMMYCSPSFSPNLCLLGVNFGRFGGLSCLLEGWHGRNCSYYHQVIAV